MWLQYLWYAELHVTDRRALSGELFFAETAAQLHCWQLEDNTGDMNVVPQVALEVTPVIPHVITGVVPAILHVIPEEPAQASALTMPKNKSQVRPALTDCTDCTD